MVRVAVVCPEDAALPTEGTNTASWPLPSAYRWLAIKSGWCCLLNWLSWFWCCWLITTAPAPSPYKNAVRLCQFCMLLYSLEISAFWVSFGKSLEELNDAMERKWRVTYYVTLRVRAMPGIEWQGDSDGWVTSCPQSTWSLFAQMIPMTDLGGAAYTTRHVICEHTLLCRGRYPSPTS